MDIPEILDDEFIGGYAARIAKVNALEDATQVALAMLPANERRPTLEVAFARQLSTRVAALGRNVFRRHGVIHALLRDPQVENLRRPRRFGLLRPGRSHPMFCPDCVASDSDQRGFAHWRRSHQLPGAFACDEHSTELVQSSQTSFGALMPFDVKYKARQHCAHGPASVRDNPRVHTALAILRRAADIPLPGDNWKEVLVDRIVRTACASGFDDAMRRAFPSEWLERLKPYIAMGRGNSSSMKPEHITTVGIALICGASFDCAEAAIDRLYGPPAQSELFEGLEARNVTRMWI